MRTIQLLLPHCTDQGIRFREAQQFIRVVRDITENSSHGSCSPVNQNDVGKIGEKEEKHRDRREKKTNHRDRDRLERSQIFG